MSAKWPEERLEKLMEMWPVASASVIGKLLGCTRCSVIGKARRLGLVRKQRSETPIARKERTSQEPKYKIISPAMIPFIPRSFPVQSNPVPLMKAKRFQCRAIVDGVDDDGLVMVCGNRIEANQRYSFCTEHLSLYTTKGYAR